MPPPQAYPVAAALIWNYARSRRGQPTISRWACRRKPIALGAVGVLAWHWWKYET